MRIRLSILLIVFCASIWGATIIDTLGVRPEISGTIDFDQQLNVIRMFGFPMSYCVGDGWNAFEFYYFGAYTYLTFPCPEKPEGYKIEEAFLYLCCHAIIGNGESSTYPIFDSPNGGHFNPYLILDHIDYGISLDEQDIHIPPSQLDQPLYLQNWMDYGWFAIDVKDFVINDVEEGRMYSQYRLRLQNNADWDDYDDLLQFECCGEDYRPHILCTFRDATSADDNVNAESDNVVTMTAFPNPFNPTTTIAFSIPTDSRVTLDVFNIRGQKVRTLLDERMERGEHSVQWTGDDDNGKPCSSGVYLYRMKAGETTKTSRMLLMK